MTERENNCNINNDISHTSPHTPGKPTEVGQRFIDINNKWRSQYKRSSTPAFVLDRIWEMANKATSSQTQVLGVNQ